jgi:hypothetical protein
MNSILETRFIISLYTLHKFLSYTMPLSTALQTAAYDVVSALNHISDIVAQLKDVRTKSPDTFHAINELQDGGR